MPTEETTEATDDSDTTSADAASAAAAKAARPELRGGTGQAGPLFSLPGATEEK